MHGEFQEWVFKVSKRILNEEDTILQCCEEFLNINLFSVCSALGLKGTIKYHKER